MRCPRKQTVQWTLALTIACLAQSAWAEPPVDLSGDQPQRQEILVGVNYFGGWWRPFLHAPHQDQEIALGMAAVAVDGGVGLVGVDRELAVGALLAGGVERRTGGF